MSCTTVWKHRKSVFCVCVWMLRKGFIGHGGRDRPSHCSLWEHSVWVCSREVMGESPLFCLYTHLSGSSLVWWWLALPYHYRKRVHLTQTRRDQRKSLSKCGGSINRTGTYLMITWANNIEYQAAEMHFYTHQTDRSSRTSCYLFEKERDRENRSTRREIGLTGWSLLENMLKSTHPQQTGTINK